MLRRAVAGAVLAVLVAAGTAEARVKPVAALSGSATVKAGTKVTFDAGSSTHDPAGSIVEYAWDLDGSGGFAIVRETPRLTTTLDTPGEIRVAVRVTDDVGATSVAVGSFLVEGAPPVARIAYSSPVVAGVPVTLDGSSSSSTSGDIVGYAWDLDGEGFGPLGSVPTATTTFTEPGTVTVSLRVRDSATGEGTVQRQLQVYAPGTEPASPASALGGDAALGVAPLDAIAQRWLRVGSARHFAAINGAARRRLGAARAHGLWVNLLADRPARFVLDVHVRRKVARSLGLRGPAARGQVRIARVRYRLPAAGQRPFRIALRPRVRRALRRPLTLTVRGTATDSSGNRSAVSRAFALRR